MLKYQQIAADIEQEIVDKDLQQGDKLPVLDAFMAQFDVSKSTITKALDLLEKKGIVYQVRGSGIFVRRHKRRGYIGLLSNQGFKKELDGFQITSEVLALDIRRPTAEATRNLAVDPAESVYYVKRVRYINGQTLCIEESYYNKSVVSYLNNEIVSESIFNYISDALGLNIGFSDLYFNVGKINKTKQSCFVCLMLLPAYLWNRFFISPTASLLIFRKSPITMSSRSFLFRQITTFYKHIKQAPA